MTYKEIQSQLQQALAYIRILEERNEQITSQLATLSSHLTALVVHLPTHEPAKWDGIERRQ